LHTDCEEPSPCENFEDDEPVGDLDNCPIQGFTKENNKTMPQLVRTILEQHDALQKCFTEVQEYITQTDQENCKLRSERDDAQHELTDKMKQHVEDIRELRCNLSEVVHLYDSQSTRCASLESEKQQLEQTLKEQRIEHQRMHWHAKYAALLETSQESTSGLNSSRNEPQPTDSSKESGGRKDVRTVKQRWRPGSAGEKRHTMTGKK
jgi:chromosome segregation ATPase